MSHEDNEKQTEHAHVATVGCEGNGLFSWHFKVFIVTLLVYSSELLRNQIMNDFAIAFCKTPLPYEICELFSFENSTTGK